MKKIILALIIALLPLLACGGEDTKSGNDSYDVCRDCRNSERVDLEEKR